MENKKFVKAKEIRGYCKRSGLRYDNVVNNLEKRGYLVRIFRGIFYLKSFEELNFGIKYNHLELVAKGLELKGIKNWYFGLHTALKINNMTHEHFAIDEVVSDKLFRSEPIKISGNKFRFIKFSPKMLDFGIKEKKGIRFSDPEKTILDFIYTWRNKGIPVEKIVGDIDEWAIKTTRTKLNHYLKNYPNTVKHIVERVMK